jgi:hypothetical protein
MAFDAYGAPQFGLNDVKIATWTATNTYSAAVDVYSVQLMGAVLQIISAQLTGDDTITATAARAVGGEVRIRFGSVQIPALEVLLGNTATSSVASPNTVKQLKLVGGDNMPYFGIAGKALAEEGTGDFLIFFPKCRIMSDVTLATLEYGTFAIPELTLQAVDDATYGICSVIERQTAAAVTIPPANIL